MCNEKMKHAFDYLFGPEGPEIVVFAFFGYYAETTDVAADHVLNGKGPSHIRLIGDRLDESKEDVLSSGLERSIGLLLEHGKRVYLVIDIPELPFLPRDCVQRPFFKKLTTCYLERDVVDQRQQALRRIARRLQERFPRLAVFDPLPLFCSSSQCKPVLDEFSFYDSHHLSARGSEAVAAPLVELIDRTAR